jgi:hypothetical protein
LLVKQSSSGKPFAPLRFEVLAVDCCLWRQKSVPLNLIAALAQLLLLLSLARVCLPLALQLCGSREDERERLAVFQVTTKQTTSRRLKIVVNDCLRHFRGPVKTHYD